MSPEIAVSAVRFPSFTAPGRVEDPVAPPPLEEIVRAARDAAFVEGVAQGRADGRAAALAEWTPRLAALAAAMDAATAALSRRREELAKEVGAHVADVVLVLARKVLDHELAMGDRAVRATAEQLARRLCAGGVIGIRVAPSVADVLLAWRGTEGTLGDVAVRADATLACGDFIIETDAGFLDGRVATQLAEAARILTEPAP